MKNGGSVAGNSFKGSNALVGDIITWGSNELTDLTTI